MPINYDMIPRATYCQPQIASFGYTEQQAKDKGHDVKVGKFPFSANGKALGPRRRRRLRQDRRRRRVQRDPRRRT
jgi:pyruvate/2-oxoglutarate dehydrogenase complex dihydrolipoamide dehydrogenase (E3) component